jgi:hypothetical protein
MAFWSNGQIGGAAGFAMRGGAAISACGIKPGCE